MCPVVTIEVQAHDPEEVGIITSSQHADIRAGNAVRAVYFQELEATGELDVYRLEVGGQWYHAEPDERDPRWSRQCRVVFVIGGWPDDWDDGPAFQESDARRR